MKDRLQATSEEIFRQYYRIGIRRLTELNGISKIMRVMGTTREVFTGLVPMQPPDIEKILADAHKLGLETVSGQKPDGRELDVFIGAYIADREAWDASLDEWRKRSEGK